MCAVLLLAIVRVSTADVVTDWNSVLLDAIRTDRTAPPRAARAMAMVHTAVFDALNGYLHRYDAYHVTADAPRMASQQAAAAGAAHRVLGALFPAQAATFDAALARSLAGVTSPKGREAGLAWGESCADEILALRADDHADDVVVYVPTMAPGFWRPTPPGFAAALLPNWPTVTPWAMTSGAQFRGPGPPALDGTAYAAAFNEVKELGRDRSAVRTAEQTEIALFWADGAGTATPAGHWQVIAQGLAGTKPGSLVANARLFALLGIAVADAGIVAWDNKYAFEHWRPITGIREADTDGNPYTVADPSWTPLLPTPPFPSYTSGHSTFSAAAATVLAQVVGTDDVSFSSTSDGLPGVTRSFTSLWEAALEAGQSRIYGGIHWQYDNQDALVAGAALGHYVVDHFLRPRPGENDQG